MISLVWLNLLIVLIAQSEMPMRAPKNNRPIPKTIVFFLFDDLKGLERTRERN